jgi:TRAP-type C4-dicarboxylate transport system permease small subunit
LSALERAADRLFGWLALAGVLLLMAAMLVVMADIVARKLAGFSITGTVDIQQLAQMACVFFVLPLAFLREANITIDFVSDPLPPRALAGLRCAVQLVCAILLGAMAWYSLGQASIQVGNGDKSQTLGIPLVLYWVPLLAGLVMSVAATLVLALKSGLAATR